MLTEMFGGKFLLFYSVTDIKVFHSTDIKFHWGLVTVTKGFPWGYT